MAEKAMAPHSSTLAWKIPWMEEPGGLRSMGSLRVGHVWATSLSPLVFMHWRRKWQPTPVFLPGEIPGTGEPGGLPCMGSHRVGHDWSDLAVAAVIDGGFLGESVVKNPNGWARIAKQGCRHYKWQSSGHTKKDLCVFCSSVTLEETMFPVNNWFYLCLLLSTCLRAGLLFHFSAQADFQFFSPRQILLFPLYRTNSSLIFLS